jgi:hypothetical protein
LDKRVLYSVALLAALAGLLSCGDSDDTPLGSEFIGDLLGSVPGVVFQDSISIDSGDTVYTYYRPIDKQYWFEVGIQNDYERIPILKADFSVAGSDTLKTVLSATLRLTGFESEGYVAEISAMFYQMGTGYTEGDSITTVDTTTVIPDPGNNDASVRLLRTGILAYQLPPALVEGWITGNSVHNGIAIVYAGNSTNELYEMSSRQATDNRPSILVNFSDGTSTNYAVTDDCFVSRPLSATGNLVISDGFVRRVYFPIDLEEINDSAAVHEARVVFNFVPGTVFGARQVVLLYVPDSSDPSDKGFLTGRGIVSVTLDSGTGVLELPLTNVLLLVLSGEIEDNGYVLRFQPENDEVQQAEFYSGSHPTLLPKVYITYSTPAEFRE